MRGTDDPALLTYLAAENDWCERSTTHLAGLRADLERDLAAILPDDDVSAPWRLGRWELRIRRPAGSQYAVHVRVEVEPTGQPTADEQVLLDENTLAAGHDFLELGVCAMSPNGQLVAYSLDLDGSEVYTIRFRDVAAGTDLVDEIPGTYYGLAWAADGSSVLYTTLDDTYRPDRIKRHVLGRPATEDTVVWHETDRRFELEVDMLRSGEFIRLSAHSRDTTEVRLVPTADLAAEPVLVAPRRPAVEYAVDHRPSSVPGEPGELIIVTDLDAPEYRVVVALLSASGTGEWIELVAHDPSVRIESAEVFGDHIVVEERSGGVARVRVLDRAGTTIRIVTPAAPGEQVRIARPTSDASTPGDTAVRLVREGFVRPPLTVHHDMITGSETVVHEQPIVRSMAGLACETVHARADDGTEVPMTVLRHGSADGPAPCLLYGYGSYEASLDAEFWPDLLPLLDRGVVVAIAHPRGGGELGRQWWQQGRLMNKMNTFTDFIACAQHLVTAGVTTPETLAARGMSAGGLLMGAVAHLGPENFAVIVAEVPFVDVVSSMLDDTLPLTVAEWEEWGDPRIPEQAAYLASYSPYENRPGPRRPAMLVTASLHDPRVSVHEPAKWVAAMREDEMSAPAEHDAPLLLRTALGGGAHSGPACRYDAWAHEAFLHAVTLDHITRSQDLERQR